MQHLYVFDLVELIALTKNQTLALLQEHGGNEKDLRSWYEWCISHSLRETFLVDVRNHVDHNSPGLHSLFREAGEVFSRQIGRCIGEKGIKRIDSDTPYVGVFDGQSYYLIACTPL